MKYTSSCRIRLKTIFIQWIKSPNTGRACQHRYIPLTLVMVKTGWASMSKTSTCPIEVEKATWLDDLFQTIWRHCGDLSRFTLHRPTVLNVDTWRISSMASCRIAMWRPFLAEWLGNLPYILIYIKLHIVHILKIFINCYFYNTLYFYISARFV